MTRITFTLLAVAALALPARAHFIWIIPGPDGRGARVVFGDELKPTGPEFLPKIERAEFWALESTPTAHAVAKTRDGASYRLDVPEGLRGILAGECRYGTLSRGSKEPFLLIYHARAALPFELGKQPATPCERLTLDIVPLGGADVGRFQVLWQGKPLAGAEVSTHPAGDQKTATLKTDGQGRFEYRPTAAGLYGLRVLHEEPTAGEHQGKKYKTVRHYATLTFTVP